jgi:serine/threonine protein kinase/tetratricopeptide (TPR) repeat protein
MAEVWKARDEITGQTVAVKLMSAMVDDELFEWRFRHEVRAMARLEHPSIIRVYDYGMTDTADGTNRAFLVMEHASMGSLRDHAWRLDRWPLLLTLFLEVLDALAYSHARRLVHLDLKPENILLSREGDLVRFKLADFGISRAFFGEPEDLLESASEMAAGTPAYMPPEQIRGEWRDFGPATDLYALGCMAWELICGAPPFQSDSLVKLAIKHTQSPLPQIEPRIRVPDGTRDWLNRLLAKSANDRYNTAADAARALAALGEHSAGETSRIMHVDALAEPEPEPAEVAALRDTAPVLSSTLVLPTQQLRTTQRDLGEGLDAPDAPAPSPAEASQDHPIPTNWRDTEYDFGKMQSLIGADLLGIREVRLVGREDERDLLWSTFIECVELRSPRGVILRGKAGTGKSRLAKWLIRRCEELGVARVLRGLHEPHDTEMQGISRALAQGFKLWGLDYKATQERMRQLLELMPFPEAGARDEAQLDEDSAVLASVVASTRRAGDGSRLRESRRMSAVCRIIRRMARTRPLIIWLDDAQWARRSLEVMRLLLAEDDLPILLVATARDDVLIEDAYAAKELDFVDEMRGIVTRWVNPLRVDEATEMVGHSLPLDTASAEEVARRTRGNPLLALQVLTDWVERDVLTRTPAGFEVRTESASFDLEEVCLRRVENAVSEQNETHPEYALLTLEYGAALGEDIRASDWSSVCELAGLDADPERLAELLADRGIVVPTGDGWKFVHGAFRDALLARAGRDGDLAVLHGHCAEMLLADYPTPSFELLDRIGHHLQLAARHEEAIEHMLDSARLKRWHGMRDSTERTLDAIEGLMDREGVPQDAWSRAELKCARVALLAELGEFDASMTLLDELEADFDLSERIDIRGAAGYLRGAQQVMFGKFDEALPTLDQSADDLKAAEKWENAARALYWKADVFRRRAEYEKARRYFLEAKGLLDPKQHPYMYGGLMDSLGYLSAQMGDYDKAQAYLDEVLAHWDQHVGPAPTDYGDALCSRGEVERLQGNMDKALTWYERAIHHYRCLDARMQESTVWLNKGIAHFELGQYQDAKDCIEDVRASLLEYGDPTNAAMAAMFYGACVARESDWEAWAEQVDPSLEWLESHDVYEREHAEGAEAAGRAAAEAGRQDLGERALVYAAEAWEKLQEPEAAERVREAMDELEKVTVDR